MLHSRVRRLPGRWAVAMAMVVSGVLAGLLGCAPARAGAGGPKLFPTRDAQVDYTATAGGRENHIRVYYQAGGGHLRVEAQGQNSYLLIDLPARRMQVVMDQTKAVMDMPFDPDHMRSFLLSDTAHYARGGSETVAGVPCTDWTVTVNQGSGRDCVTDDGLILRAVASSDAGTTSGTIVATAVSYDTPPAALFAVPDGYRTLSVPAPRAAAPK